jgi:protein-L-isoaspartate(D-aspartate) O-methyltransferase
VRLAETRERFAAALLHGVGSERPGLRRAFSRVERERFLGPPPWTTLDPYAALRVETTEDPADLYRDVVVVIDAARDLNNGQPSLHARLLDALAPERGERALHVGAGTGYFSAILACCLGSGGALTALEIEPALAARAAANLEPWRWARVLCADGSALDFGEFDAIYVSAGATHVPELWLDRLAPGGRLVIPLTCAAPRLTAGLALRIRRETRGHTARFVSPIAIYPCAGARDPVLEAALVRAFLGGGHAEVQSLRHGEHAQDASCWLHAPWFCLSRRPPD